MENSKRLRLIVLASATLILFFIVVSSKVSAAAEQSASSAGTYAYITNGGSNSVSVIDTSTNTVTATIKVGKSPEGVVVNPNGKKVYVTNINSNTVSVINTTTNKVTATINGFYKPIGAAFSPDGKKAYVISSGYTVENDTGWYSFGGNVSIIDTATNRVIDKVDIGSDPYGMTITPDGKKLYITYSFAYYIYYGLSAYEYSNASVFDTTTKNITTLQLRGMPFGVTVSPDGKKVYVANQITDIERIGFTTQKKYYPIVSVVDTVTNKVIDTEKIGDAPQGVAVSPNGKKVYVTDWKDRIVSVIDTTTVTVIATVPVGSSPEGIAVNPDGKKVYVANRGSNTVSVIDTATNKVIATVPVGSSPEGIAFSRALKKVLPVANFTSDVTSGKAPLKVQFTDKSTGTPTKWKWTFGDGMNSIQQNPVHKYSKAGNYTVVLTVTNTVGSNTTTKTNYIKVIVKPVAAFSASPTSGKAPLTVAFTDKSSGIPTSWKWSFGDGKTSTAQTPKHKYTAEGKYTVSLTVKNAAGSNMVTKTNYITVKK